MQLKASWIQITYPSNKQCKKMSQSILQDVKQQIDLLTWNERLDLIAYIKKGQAIAKRKDFEIV